MVSHKAVIKNQVSQVILNYSNRKKTWQTLLSWDGTELSKVIKKITLTYLVIHDHL